MDLPDAVAGNIFPNLIGFRQIHTGTVLGIEFAVICAAWVRNQNHRRFKGIRLHRHVGHSLAGVPDANETEAVVKSHFRNCDADPAAVFAAYPEGIALLLFGQCIGHDLLAVCFPVQLVQHHHILADPQARKRCGILDSHSDASLVPFALAHSCLNFDGKLLL